MIVISHVISHMISWGKIMQDITCSFNFFVCTFLLKNLLLMLNWFFFVPFSIQMTYTFLCTFV